MGRNSHNKIKNGQWKNRKFNVNGVKRMVDRMQKKEEAAIMLNAVLLFMPWAVLFGLGSLVSPVYAQGADVSTDLDTLLFVGGGIIVFVLAVAFALMLKGKERKRKRE